MKSTRIFIVGHPGAGKALLGDALADKLGWQLINADLGLEFKIGERLGEILGAEGLKHYQQCLLKTLKTQCVKNNIIVITDAGIVDSKECRALLADNFTINLQVDTDTQMERTQKNPDPLLPINNLKNFFKLLHQERDHYYGEVSSININSNDNKLDDHVNKIIAELNKLTSQSLAINDINISEKEMLFRHKTLHTLVTLSRQQAICLKLLAKGLSSKEIAYEMNISHRTVEDYISKILDLLGCRSSKEVLALYHEKK